MATRKNTRPKAARLRLTATEAMLRAAKAAETGDLQAAYDAAQSAVVAMKESIALHDQWPEWETGKLDTILRGGAPTVSEMPLGELSAACRQPRRATVVSEHWDGSMQRLAE